MTQKAINKYLKECHEQLILQSPVQIHRSANWKSEIPNSPGVYILSDKRGNAVYVGESGNLRKRMSDISDTRHHSLRRSIGKKFFSKERGYEEATIKVKFPPHIEKLVDKYMNKKLTLKFLPVELGRKELEEYIEIKMDKEISFNSRGKRK